MGGGIVYEAMTVQVNRKKAVREEERTFASR